jgi:hypothetical protein
MQPIYRFGKEKFLLMNTTRMILVLFCALCPCLLWADNEDHINDLASRYDLVGIVTQTSVLKWNTNNDSSKMARIYPIDPKKIPEGALYVGLAKDVNDPDRPYFGDIFVKGTLYGYNQLFVRVHEVKGQQMQASDDDGNDYVIQVIRTGSGYKKQ